MPGCLKFSVPRITERSLWYKMEEALNQGTLLLDTQKKAGFSVKPEFADFENAVFAAIGDCAKCQEVLKTIYSEFTFDFNNPKFKKYTTIIKDAVCNGFKVRKQDNGLLVTSAPVSCEIVKKVSEYLPKTLEPQTWISEVKKFYGIKTDQSFYKDFWLAKNLYDYAKLGISFSPHAHHVCLMPFKDKNGNFTSVAYIQLEGVKHLMSKGGCKNLAYEVILNNEEFSVEKTNTGDKFSHKFGVRNGENITIDNIKGAYAYCELKGHGYLEFMTVEEIRTCYECSETHKAIQKWNDTKKHFREAILLEEQDEADLMDEGKSKVLTEEEIEKKIQEKIDDYNKSIPDYKNKIKPPQTPWYRFPGEMIKKTVIRRLFKRIGQFLSSNTKQSAMKVLEADDMLEYDFK